MAIAIRRETFATWMFPLVLVFVGGSRAPSLLIDSLNPSLAPPSTEWAQTKARTKAGVARIVNQTDSQCAVGPQHR